MRRASIALALVAVIASCSTWDGSGRVVEKKYDDPDVRVRDGGSSCMGYDSNGFCTFRVEHPDTTYTEPARWLLEVEDGEDGKRHEVSIGEAAWNDCAVGDWFATETGVCE